MYFSGIPRQNHPGFKTEPKSKDLVVSLYGVERTHRDKVPMKRCDVGNSAVNTKERLEKVGRGRKESPVDTSEGARPGQHLGFRLLAPRTERINFCGTQVPQVCGNCYSWPSPLLVLTKGTKNGFQATKQEMPSALWTSGWVLLMPGPIHNVACPSPTHAYLCAHLGAPAENDGYNQLPGLHSAPGAIWAPQRNHSPGSHSQGPSWDQGGSR